MVQLQYRLEPQYRLRHRRRPSSKIPISVNSMLPIQVRHVHNNNQGVRQIGKIHRKISERKAQIAQKAAMRFLKKAVRQQCVPRKINTDRSGRTLPAGAAPASLRGLGVWRTIAPSLGIHAIAVGSSGILILRSALL